MSCRTIAVMGFGALAFLVGYLLGPLPLTRDTKAAPPREPGKSEVFPEAKHPDPLPPPTSRPIPTSI